MGWLKALLNINKPEGCREAMRLAYARNLKHLSVRPADVGTPLEARTPHRLAMYAALYTRHRVRGEHASEVLIWPILAPFLLMDEAEAVEAPAEYAVFEEKPDLARAASLRAQINRALFKLPDAGKGVKTLMGMALTYGSHARQWNRNVSAALRVDSPRESVAWLELLDADVEKRVMDTLLRSAT
jgi:hypothetical protein